MSSLLYFFVIPFLTSWHRYILRGCSCPSYSGKARDFRHTSLSLTLEGDMNIFTKRFCHFRLQSVLQMMQKKSYYNFIIYFCFQNTPFYQQDSAHWTKYSTINYSNETAVCHTIRKFISPWPWKSHVTQIRDTAR